MPLVLYSSFAFLYSFLSILFWFFFFSLCSSILSDSVCNSGGQASTHQIALLAEGAGCTPCPGLTCFILNRPCMLFPLNACPQEQVPSASSQLIDCTPSRLTNMVGHVTSASMHATPTCRLGCHESVAPSGSLRTPFEVLRPFKRRHCLRETAIPRNVQSGTSRTPDMSDCEVLVCKHMRCAHASSNKYAQVPFACKRLHVQLQNSCTHC